MDDQVTHTRRCTVRRWRSDDINHLMAVYGDAEAMRWVGDGQPITAEQCERWMDVTQANYASRGYGMYTVELTETKQVIGFVGLVHPGGQPEPELKYAYQRNCWGAGLATEVAAGVLRYAHEELGLRKVIATAAPDNEASHRVLSKAGMRRGQLMVYEDGSRTQVFIWEGSDPA